MGLQTNVAGKQEREARRANLAKRTRERVNQVSDGGIHAVDRKSKPVRVEEVADAATIERPAKRRWKRASHLPHMPDLPGYALKWVRTDGRNAGDNRGVFKHLQEQWEFARKSDFPKSALPTQSLGQHGEVIGNGDMVLMKIHEDLREQRNAHFNGKRDRATEGIESELQQYSDDRMPIRQRRKTSIEFRRMRDRVKVRSPEVADNDDL